MSPTDHPKGAAGLRAHDVKPQEPAKGSAARAGGFAGWSMTGPVQPSR